MIEEGNDNLLGTAQCRRWIFTINNPLSEYVEEIDISKTDLPIKENYYSDSVMSELEATGCFDFKYVKITSKVEDLETKEYIVKRPFFKSIDSASLYFESLDNFKYCMFQLEKGEEGTLHFQGFLIFVYGIRFNTIKNMLPMAHIEKVQGSNSQCRAYCSKKDTRVEGPFEIGKFAEERARTDISNFMEMIRAGVDDDSLSRLYPTLFLREKNKIDSIRAMNYTRYKHELRDVKVTYIYGDSGKGKTYYVDNLLKDSAFWIHTYDLSMFTNYEYQDNIVFDEFSGDVKIATLNMFLNSQPVQLRGLNCVKYGAYHNVYIISNYSPQELYKEIQQSKPNIFKTFYRRLNTIIHYTGYREWKYDRLTEWEENEDESTKQRGLKEQISKIWEFDNYGNKTLTFDRHKEIPELQPVDNSPFDDIDENGNLKF